MNILYVYAHPNPNSFNAQLKDTALKTFADHNTNVKVSDLYAMQFKSIADNSDFLDTTNIDPQYFTAQHHAYTDNSLSSDINSEIEKIEWADHIIFQFPLWWFSAPAILKGWFDRVFIKGFAYDAEHIFENGLLNDKTASFVITTQSSELSYQTSGVHGHSLEEFLLPIHHTLRFAGIRVAKPFYAYAAFNLDEKSATSIKDNYEKHLTKITANAP